MPSIKDSALGGFIFWPQLEAEARREFEALPTSKTAPTEENVLLDRYAERMRQRGVLGQALVIMSPVFFVLLGLTQRPNFGWAALVALFGGLATFVKAAWDSAKQDDPDFKPPRDNVRTWDMNDWREGAWVILVVGGFGCLAALWFVLDKLLWSLVPIAPMKLREISRSFGRTDDLESEKLRALFTNIFCVGAILFAWLHFWFVASIMLATVVLLSVWQHHETKRCTEGDLDPNKNPT